MGRNIVVAAVVAAGAGVWLRWSVTPVLAAFRAGMEVGRINAGKEAAAGGGVGVPPQDPGPVGGRRRPRLARRAPRPPGVHRPDPGGGAGETGEVPSPAA